VTIRIQPLAILLALAIALPFGATAGAKSYRHPSIRQVVSILPDGTVDVVDTREYRFDGEYHNAFVPMIPRDGGEGRLIDVQAVDGGSVRNVRVESNVIRWQYDARDETRTFAIHYQLTGEVARAPDAALFDRLVLENEHAVVDLYELTIRVAGPAAILKLFLITQRGRVGEMDVKAEEGRANVTLNSLSGDEWVRARVIFDQAVVPDLAVGGEPRYEEWLRETSIETQSYRDNVRRTLTDSGGASRPPRPPISTLFAPLLWLVASVFSWWAFKTYRAHGVEPEIAGIGEYFREPPEEIPPGAVPFIMDQASPGITAAPQAFGATLLDFARRGFLTLSEREKPGFLGLGGGREVDFVLARPPGEGEVTPFERDVWRLLEEARREDDRVKPDEMVKFFRKHTTWMQNWVENPRTWYESTKERLLVGNHGGRMFLLIGGGILLMAGMILFGAFSNNPVVFISAILAGVTAGLFGVICGAGIPKWRPAPLRRARQWKAYRRFLSDFSAMKDAPAEHYKLWDHHFVYATALGVSKNYLANLKKLMAQEPDRFATPAWIMSGHDMGRLGSVAQNLDSIQSNLASLSANLAAVESALSSATSSGGGFSGGGSGGASGGGSSGAS